MVRLGLLIVLGLPAAAEMKAVLYLNGEAASVRSFLAHAEKIDIVIPTFYAADAEGRLTGFPEEIVLAGARKHGVPVMPIVVNPGFTQATIHSMLGDSAAHQRLAQGLLDECRKNKYYGIQFDFENIPASDREALTALVGDTAQLLGKEGFRLSIAVMYQTAAAPGPGPYARWLWENWLGAYDLRAIEPHVEFVSVMTYDQHTERTPPGPIAGFPWVEQALDYSLTVVPKEKLSLGIPLYGRRWFAGVIGVDAAPLTATVHAHEAAELAAKMNVTPQWDPAARAPWFWFERDGVREYVFYNDARSFRERYDLARKRGLHGFSAWVLGSEDPEIWKNLPQANR